MNVVLIPSKITRPFLLTIFLFAHTKFVLYRLPKRTRVLFVSAGLIFLAGAIGVEMLGGRHAELYSYDLTTVLFQTAEETLNTGIFVFIYALRAYITSELSDVRLVAPSRQELL